LAAKDRLSVLKQINARGGILVQLDSARVYGSSSQGIVVIAALP
jgi:hypothetical protein